MSKLGPEVEFRCHGRCFKLDFGANLRLQSRYLYQIQCVGRKCGIQTKLDKNAEKNRDAIMSVKLIISVINVYNKTTAALADRTF